MADKTHARFSDLLAWLVDTRAFPPSVGAAAHLLGHASAGLIQR
jgi:hypothetical protein